MHLKIELTTTSPSDLKLIAELLQKINLDESPSGEYAEDKKPSSLKVSKIIESDEDARNVEAEAASGRKKRGPYKKRDKEVAETEDDEEDEPKPKKKAKPVEDDEEDEPKPKKKKAAVEDDDDEEDEPKPKKKAKPSDDEDDEEDEPKPKKKSGSIDSKEAFAILKKFMNDAQDTGSEKKLERAQEHVAAVLKKFGFTNPRFITDEVAADVIKYHEKLLAS